MLDRTLLRISKTAALRNVNYDLTDHPTDLKEMLGVTHFQASGRPLPEMLHRTFPVVSSGVNDDITRHLTEDTVMVRNVRCNISDRLTEDTMMAEMLTMTFLPSRKRAAPRP